MTVKNSNATGSTGPVWYFSQASFHRIIPKNHSKESFQRIISKNHFKGSFHRISTKCPTWIRIEFDKRHREFCHERILPFSSPLPPPFHLLSSPATTKTALIKYLTEFDSKVAIALVPSTLPNQPKHPERILNLISIPPLELCNSGKDKHRLKNPKHQENP